MKIRIGFVSNSSTSSFCIFGAELSSFDLPIEDIDGTGLERYSPYGNHVYVGRSWCSIEDNETGAAFKVGVQQKISFLLKESGHIKAVPDFQTYELAWTDN